MLQVAAESYGTHLVEILSAAFAAAGTCLVPVALYIWSSKRKERESNQKLAVLREDKQDQRHIENQRALAKINTTLEWNPPHVHIEDDDDGPSVPLMSGNIRYGPRKRT